MVAARAKALIRANAVIRVEVTIKGMTRVEAMSWDYALELSSG